MEINNNKNYLSRIRVIFIMLLFAMCLTMNMFFCSPYNLYELSYKTTVIETRVISESVAANDGSDRTNYFKTTFLNKDGSYHKIITKNTCSILMAADIQKGISLLLFLIVVFLFFLLTLFILLPDEWTLINQKVRLDN